MRRRSEAALLVLNTLTPAEFRGRLAQIEPRDRDDWVNRRLGFGEVPPDGSDLPRGCVPYLPSSVETVLRVVDRARVTAGDVFVDVGSGLGRAMTLVHLLTGAEVVGLEVQSELVRQANAIAEAHRLDHVRTLHGDAETLIGRVTRGTVFFFYCPFGRDRLLRVLQALRPLAATRPLRLCFVDMPVPALAWLGMEVAAGDPITICAAHGEASQSATGFP